MNVLAHVETNQCMCCNVISHALRRASMYPMAQKDVADLCLYQLQCAY